MDEWNLHNIFRLTVPQEGSLIKSQMSDNNIASAVFWSSQLFWTTLYYQTFPRILTYKTTPILLVTCSNDTFLVLVCPYWSKTGMQPVYIQDSMCVYRGKMNILDWKCIIHYTSGTNGSMAAAVSHVSGIHCGYILHQTPNRAKRECQHH